MQANQLVPKQPDPGASFPNGNIDRETVTSLLAQLETNATGLSSAEAARRPKGAILRKRPSVAKLLVQQFSNAIVLILIGAALLSFFLGDKTNALIILAIVFASGFLGFWQEHRAAGALEALLGLVEVKATVIRDGAPAQVAIGDVVRGDVIVLSAGDILPADAALLEAKELYVDESSLTGESFPAEKTEVLAPLKMGTHVVSGEAHAVVTAVGSATRFGKLAASLGHNQPETEFERGIRRFGYLLLEVTLILVLVIFALNVWLHRPVLESLLFALALAVGLTPQLLPAIVSVNLAHGARLMARAKVIVKRLSAIENFGSMDVLCADKTGTLTSGQLTLAEVLDPEGNESPTVRHWAQCNAFFESGFKNPLDKAILDAGACDMSAFQKLDEVPYDFTRRRLSVLVRSNEKTELVTKGAFASVLGVCDKVQLANGQIVSLESNRAAIEEIFEARSAAGFRILAIAVCEPGCQVVDRSHEQHMTFLGLLSFSDPPKATAPAAVATLRSLGVSLKMITGDNRLVAAHVASQVGLDAAPPLTGTEIRSLTDSALRLRVQATSVFAEIEPDQKERVVRALRRAGHVVGFIGDGINDVSAIREADVGLSVDGAVDVAKAASDIVLLEADLSVLARGIDAGRRVFANTLKYIFMATSANFGNMFSMAGASLLVPFLPLLPMQILLTNFLTDIPEMTIATDSVDDEALKVPRRWDIAFIRRFMLVFGILSSLFDFATFGVLLHAHVDQAGFRAAWFIESVISAAFVVLVIRTRRPFFRSRPARMLVICTAASAVVCVTLVFSPLAGPLGFAPVAASILFAIAGVVACYVITAEIVKRWFYRPTVRKA